LHGNMVMAEVKIKFVATDVDGTLTLRRGVLLISLDAIRAIRELERHNIRVSLVSGNSVPVVAGLSRYIGATGPSIAENGCVVFYEGEIYHLCEGRPSRELIEAIKKLGFKESWQNIFRFHDVAFMALPGTVTMDEVEQARRLAEKEGMRLLYSGYAIHIQPPGGGKAVGVQKAAELLGVNLRSVAVVGDAPNDLDMFLPLFFKACPGDADPEVKKRSDYVAAKPGGEGFAEIADYILNYLDS